MLIKEVDTPINPIQSFPDLEGTLANQFGGPYAECTIGVIPGSYVPAAESQESHFEIETRDLTHASDAMVIVSCSLDSPLLTEDTNSEFGRKYLGIDSEFGRTYHTDAYYRVDQADPEIDFAASHGTIIWAMPIAQLGDFAAELEAGLRHRELEARFAVRDYLQKIAYYRPRLHELDEHAKHLDMRIEYGDEVATLLPIGTPSASLATIYYDSRHLESLAGAFAKTLMISRLGGALGGLALLAFGN